jgi:hypothetical protein
MEFEYSEERRMLKESVERFVAERYGFAQRRPIAESSRRFSPEIWAALAGFGWLGLPLPEAHGGFGGAALDTGIVMEGFGRGLVLEPYVSTVVLGAGLIEAAGTPAQHAQWLPRIAAGELRIVSSATRSQLENRADAITRFQMLMAAALRRRKHRVPTRPSAAARERRLTAKKGRAEVKSTRRKVGKQDYQ